MKHLILCRELPPASEHGTGAAMMRLARSLVAAGDSVHLIGQLRHGTRPLTRVQIEPSDGNTTSSKPVRAAVSELVVHRVPYNDSAALPAWKPDPALDTPELRKLFSGGPLCFSMLAGCLAERLIADEHIDLVHGVDHEGQLYYLQLRRALGIGPQRKPPILLHLFGPTEIICGFNEESWTEPRNLLNKRLEDFSIAAADKIVAPSGMIARKAEQFYGWEAGSVPVLDYPFDLPDAPSRTSDSFRRGVVLLMGDIDARSGAVEFADAAVRLLHRQPELKFEFFGHDTPYGPYRDTMTGAYIRRRIPARYHENFIARADAGNEVPHLARARLAALPSRWCGFPDAAVEMLACGLPLLTSAACGIDDLVQDGVNGWIVPRSDSSAGQVAAIEETLERALAVTPERLEEMSRRARESVVRRFGNSGIIQAHRELYKEAIGSHSTRSHHLPDAVLLPPGLQSSADTHRKTAAVRHRNSKNESGLAVVVTCYNLGRYLPDCLQSLVDQTEKPHSFVVVDDGSTDPLTQNALTVLEQRGIRVHRQENMGLVGARNSGVRVLEESQSRDTPTHPIGYVFLDADDMLRPEFLSVASKIFAARPQVGIVSCWTHHFDAVDAYWMKPCPAFPYQWVENETATFSAVRREAFQEAGGFRPVMTRGYEDWDLFNAIMAGGWVAVTVPEILGNYRVRHDSMLRSFSAHAHAQMREHLLSRYPQLVASQAREVIQLTEAKTAWGLMEEVFTLRSMVARYRAMAKRPDKALGWLIGKMRR